MREVIGTRERGATLLSSAGYSRNVQWENTNRLLTQAGFVGMKTGTTDAAGACLIAVGGGESKTKVENNIGGIVQGDPSEARPRRETIVVVLGSSSSDARYIDARNLFAWAWRQSR